MGVNPVNGHIELRPSPTCMKHIGEPECGYGLYIISGREVYVGEKTLFNGKPWSALKAQSVLLPAEESYSPLAAYIINACKKMNCSDQVTRFKVKLDALFAAH
jgi:hypothetical protein